MTGRLLASYYHWKRRDVRGWTQQFPLRSLFVDSGAFSAYTQGVKVDLNEYAEWCLAHDDLYDVAINLDVLFDPDRSERNYGLLAAQGVRVLPVFHAGSPWSVLHDLCRDHDFVCLGGVANSSSAKAAMRAWLDRCFDIGHEYGTRFHGLGVTGWWALLRYPWASVDSTSWLSGIIYGTPRLFDDQRPHRGWIVLKLGDARSVLGAAELLARYDVEPADLLDPARHHYQTIGLLTARTWADAETWLSNLPQNRDREPILPTWTPLAVFLGTANNQTAQALSSVYTTGIDVERHSHRPRAGSAYDTTTQEG